MWLEMILDLDGGLQGYLFYKNLYYIVPYVNNFQKRKQGLGDTSVVSIRLFFLLKNMNMANY